MTETAIDVALETSDQTAADADAHANDAQQRGAGRFLCSLDEYTSATLKVLLVLTIFVGAAEYFHQRQNERVARSLELIDQWNTGGLREIYNRINSELLPIYLEQREFLQSLESVTHQNLVYANMGETFTGKDNGFTDLHDIEVDQVFNFFGRAALCADNRICDYDVINDFVGQDIRDFWRYFSQYANRRREVAYPLYGYWTERFSVGDISKSIWGIF